MMKTVCIRSICLASLLLVPFSGSAVTPMIAAGEGGSVFLNSDGSVWGTGDAGTGATSPVRLFDLPKVIAVATSGYTQFALRADGTVWTWGYGNLGQNCTWTMTNTPNYSSS